MTKRPRRSADHPLVAHGRRPEHEDLIDMTAMVDIVFFLLIFFLVTSMQSIEAVINLPAPQASKRADNVQAVPDITNDPTTSSSRSTPTMRCSWTKKRRSASRTCERSCGPHIKSTKRTG